MATVTGATKKEHDQQFMEQRGQVAPEKEEYDKRDLINIPLEHIEHGESRLPGGKLTWPGARDLVKEYANKNTDFPPIDVVSNEEGNKIPWMIADGSHRYEAAKLKGMTHIQAKVSHHDKEGMKLANKYKEKPKSK